MRQLLTLLLMISLSGCAATEGYLMGHFDTGEYSTITKIRTDAHEFSNDCADPVKAKLDAGQLAYETEYFQNYESNLPHNVDSINASKSLNYIAQELKLRYNSASSVSAIYCKLKFSSIENSATLIQHVQGNRPK